MLFGFAFLWTIAPNWPPPTLIAPSLFVPLVVIGGATVATVGTRTARATFALGGQVAIVAALGWLLVGAPDPASHAYAATSAALAAYAIFHAGLAALMYAYLLARTRAGFHSPARGVEARIVRLWGDHAAGAGVIVAVLLVLPGWLA